MLQIEYDLRESNFKKNSYSSGFVKNFQGILHSAKILSAFYSARVEAIRIKKKIRKNLNDFAITIPQLHVSMFNHFSDANERMLAKKSAAQANDEPFNSLN